MERSEIKTKVTDIVHKAFPNSEVDTNVLEYIDLVDDLGMDSLTFVAIIVEIESAFNFSVPEEMLIMENFKNVDKIVDIVENTLNLRKDTADASADT